MAHANREAVMRVQAGAHKVADIEIPLDQVDLEALDRFLKSDDVPPESMSVSELDGFLTGIAVGPELVMPSEWLPLIFGGNIPAFADPDQAQAILGAIMARYNEILHRVA